jgi:hypothetical protein
VSREYQYKTGIVGNHEDGKFYLVIVVDHGGPTGPFTRLKVPIDLSNAIVETEVSEQNENGNYMKVDNLATIEFHAKQKGLV